MRSHTSPNRHFSLVCSLALHTGLLAWVVWPHRIADAPPQQQVVDVSVVMISSFSVQQAEAVPAASPAPVEPPAPEKPAALTIPIPLPKKMALNKKESKHEQKTASAPPTTGPQSPHATQKLAAVTKPVFNAVSLHNQPPAYPADARRRGIEGEVMLEVDVTREGAARDVAITHSSGYALLDKAAREAISHWRFVPAKHDGELVEAKVEVPVEFRLE